MKRSYEQEMMDSPNLPQDLLEEDLKNLRLFNRYLGGYRCVESAIAEVVCQQRLKSFSLLDVGTGSADIPGRIVRWCQRRSIDISVVALDQDPVTARLAACRTRLTPEITVLRGDAANLPFAPRSFDFVLASQFLHHFSEEKVIAMLENWSHLARRAVIVSDLVRHPLAYYGVQILTRLCTANIMTRTDAPLSVKRAFTRTEWRELFHRVADDHFRLISVFPFRITARLEFSH